MTVLAENGKRHLAGGRVQLAPEGSPLWEAVWGPGPSR